MKAARPNDECNTYQVTIQHTIPSFALYLQAPHPLVGHPPAALRDRVRYDAFSHTDISDRLDTATSMSKNHARRKPTESTGAVELLQPRLKTHCSYGHAFYHDGMSMVLAFGN